MSVYLTDTGNNDNDNDNDDNDNNNNNNDNDNNIALVYFSARSLKEETMEDKRSCKYGCIVDYNVETNNILIHD